MGCCLHKEPVNGKQTSISKKERMETRVEGSRVEQKNFDAVIEVSEKSEKTAVEKKDKDIQKPPETPWDRLHKGVPVVDAKESEEKMAEEKEELPESKPKQAARKTKKLSSTIKFEKEKSVPVKPRLSSTLTVQGSNQRKPAGKAAKKGKQIGKEKIGTSDLTEDEKKITSEILDTSPGVSFNEVAGLEKVKAALYEIVVAPSLNPALFTGLRTPAKGVLLFGPPGNGKTMLAKAVATECKATFFNISASSITSKFVGESEKHVRSLFSAARKMQPSVIFIDEIDSMLTSRKSSEHDASRRLKTEFLVQMDGAGSNAEDRILILGATNRPFELDDAALRRMPKRVYIPLPDPNTRKGLIFGKLKNENTSLDIDAVVKLTEGYSGSDLASLCSEAAMHPLREIPSNMIATAHPSSVRPITLKDFKTAINVIRPSVKPETLKQCLQWGAAYGVK